MAHLNKEFQISPQHKVAFSMDKGEIDVRGWDEDLCKVVVESDQEVVFTHKKKINRLFLSAGEGENKKVQMYLPRTCNIFINGSYLDLSVANFDYKLKVENGNGKISVTNFLGDISLEQSKGSIELVSNCGRLKADLGNVNTEVFNHTGDLTIDAGSGDLYVKGLDGAANLVLAKGNHTVTESKGSLCFSSAGEIDITSCRFTQIRGVGAGNTVLELPKTLILNYDIVRNGDMCLFIPPNSSLNLEAFFDSVDNKVESLKTEKNPGFYRINKGAEWMAEVKLQGKHLDIQSKNDECADKYESNTSGSKEALRILKMVEEGDLDPQEAEELLEAIDKEVE
ncbi:DUF4097 family beta strand repeat-containing protein [Proteinivorax tanatarense]|uniref:DUF4097 family beta strand repeat-containing protein n=1 Tax=Proteinivorax tanatarense TaxID=1260629 RepID=A0AAU7VMZ7_9FIRM